MKKYIVEGKFLSALNDYVYDALYIKTNDKEDVCINELFHNNIQKGATVRIIVEVKDNELNDTYEISDNELRQWCIENFGTEEIGECTNCPYKKECDDFMDRHNGNTPLFG